MDPMYSFQDVIRCDLCETPVPPKHCDICHIHLCEACMGKHLSDKSKEHYIVPFKLRGIIRFIPQCTKHSKILCKKFCKTCKKPICIECEARDGHFHHPKQEITVFFRETMGRIQEDLKELELTIHPEYQNAASNMQVEKTDVTKHSMSLKTALDIHGKYLHKIIDTFIQGMKSEIDDMDVQHMSALDDKEEVINYTIAEIKQIVSDLKSLTDTKDVCLVSKYKSRNEELRIKNMPAQFQVTISTFTPRIPRMLNREQIGILSKLAITPSLPDKPVILNEIQTECAERPKETVSMSVSRSPCVLCQNDKEFWVCSQEDKFMRLYDLQGKLIKAIETKSGNKPESLARTGDGDLVYTDYSDSTINIVSNTQIRSFIQLKGWKPRGICSTSSGDLLVIMDKDDNKETKVVRYSGSTEKQTIQQDDQGKPLYSSLFPQIALFGYNKYLIENRNLDICVSDRHACAVVVVNSAGKFRFRYTGHSSANETQFEPSGIANDRWGNILIVDSESYRIDIIDKDGHFLRYIDNCGLQLPWGLCVDSRYNLFVAEQFTGKVKKIRCY